ncbi:hypothetical protein BMS3Abin04_00878 [bacterium BMS3Abin04]|nr:hypothetical protein BMS3Abin04_00878 [bacterium BMS3Abin04]
MVKKTQTSEVSKTPEVLNSAQNKLGIVKFAELYGRRNEKFEKMNENNLNTIEWKELELTEPYYFFTKKDFKEKDGYEIGFKVDKLFTNYASGVATAKDSFIIKNSIKEIKDLKMSFEKYTDKEIAHKNNINQKKVELVRNDLSNVVDDYTQILYRPFDIRYSLYSPTSDGIYQRPRPEIMKHMLKNNIAILTCKKQTSFDFQHIYISKNITDRCAVSLQTGEVGYTFPLYLYSEDGTKVPNLNQEIWDKINETVGKTEPEEILDYIYAVLHSPTYRKKYKEFLKIDFPRVPYPKDKKTFKELVKYGTELRKIHLLESPKINQFITTFPVMGSDVVEKIKYIPKQSFRHAEFISASKKKTLKPVQSDTSQPRFDSDQHDKGEVWINSEQYFGNVPEIAWNFYIGGYQPARKWLKDRKGRTLTNQDIEHYQKIIVVLTETDRIMKEIDKIKFI